MLRLGLDQPLAEGGGPVVDRLAEGLEDLGVAVLRGIFQELGEGVDQRQRVLADEMQLVPEPVEPGLLRLVEHEPGEVLVLAMEQRERDGLVDRHDLGVAEGGGEQACGSRRTPPRSASGLALPSLTRIGEAYDVRRLSDVQDPSGVRHRHLAGEQPGLARRLAGDHLELDAPFRPRVLVERRRS